MKYRPIRYWEYNDSLEGLLFFVQRCDEMLFDYTLDSYKAPALNAPFLCLEALKTISEIEQGFIDENNLSFILSELHWSIKGDNVSRDLIGSDLKYFLENAKEKNLKKHKIKLELLQKALEPIKYLNKTKDLLFTAVTSCTQKNDIENLSRSYLTSLRNIGYHSTFIYTKLHDYFYFNQKKKITKTDDLKEFFGFFNLQKNNYKVVFIASDLFLSIEKSCKTFEVVISNSIEVSNDVGFQFQEERDAGEVFVEVDGVSSFDVHSAREIAERRIELLANLYVIFHHKEKLKWRDKALIANVESSEPIVSAPPISPMKRGSDLRPEIAAAQLNTLIKSISLDRESFTKFDRIVDLHGLAIENDVIENQLLNLWTSFETIIPANPNKSKVKNIVDSLTPFLIYNYVFNLFDRLTRDLVNWNRRKLNTVLKDIEGVNNFNLTEKVALLLTAEELEIERRALYSSINNFVLLRNRCHTIHNKFKSSRNVLSVLKLHEKKTSWQIRRIYRTRNMIVHKSSKPPYTNILIENAHSYLDTLVSIILELSSSKNVIDSIEQAVEYVNMKVRSHEELLRNLDGKCNKENFTKILFGYSKL